MKEPPLQLFTWGLTAILAVAAMTSAHAQLCRQYYGGRITENFNALPVSGTTNTAATLPSGWGFSEAGSSGNLTYSASDGASSSGQTYSFGTGTSTDRAFGEVTSTTVQSTLGICLVNATGSPIVRFAVGYTGEQWRLGDPAAAVDKLEFQYSKDPGATLSSGIYINVDALDFSSPNKAAVAGPLNGNSATNRTVFPPVLIEPSAPIPHGQILFMRWLPVLIAGNNDGLAIDDWSFDAGTPCNLDLDLNGHIDPLTDGVMLMRAMLGLTGTAVTNNALGDGATRTDWTEMAFHLNAACSTNFSIGP